MYLLGSWYAYAVIPAGVLVLGTAGFAVATSIEMLLYAENFLELRTLHDVVLAASFIIFLTRSRTGFRRIIDQVPIYHAYPGRPQPVVTSISYVNAVLAVANSRRTFTESSRDLDGFGTFGLSVHPQPSQGSPIRMEHFNASTSSNAEGIDLHLKALPTDSRRNNLGVDSAII
ncbi:hypothetical protein BD310DRAFT_910692 [Dichomitus squalens]|uniref:Uncharacterized protein n=1 Tax=Dichomitus squalens TaxID=114155 RepID=A0A4Q9PBM1_9APHY|nr:hypothetical protein BD310DRAFT_910692 [Dichomitus squalens]